MAKRPNDPFEKEVHAVITLDASGRPEVKGPPIHVRRRGSIYWTCAEGEWKVEVKSKYGQDGPFEVRADRVVEGKAGEENGKVIHDQAHMGGDPRTDPGAPAGARGLYRYSITVWVNGDERTEDPEIVIGPET